MSDSTKVPSFWRTAEDVMTLGIPYFQPRPQQAALAGVLHSALSSRKPVAVEAATGSGKSYAALIVADRLRDRTVISTATRALQSQYATRDIPALQDLGLIRGDVAVLEGRSNYVCWNRVSAALADSPQPESKKILKRILALQDTIDGKRESIPGGVPDWIWSRIASDADVCRAQECGGQDCPYQAARDAARRADIVVVNHHVLLADAAIKAKSAVAWGRRGATPDEPDKPAVLGPYRTLIVDEAHALESAAESFGERKATVRGIQALVARVGKVPGTTGAANHLEEAARILGRAADGMEKGVLLEPTNGPPILLGAADRARRARSEIRDAVSGAYEDQVRGEILASLCTSLADRLESIDEALRTGEDDIGPRAPSAFDGGIVSQLVEVGPWLEQHVWDQVPAALMSGTMTVPGRPEHVVLRAGLHVPVEVLPPVFDMRKQRLVYVTPRADKGGGARVGDADIEELEALLEASNGRALVLFPANIDLKFTYERLRSPHTVLAQGITLSEQEGAPKNAYSSRRRGWQPPADAAIAPTAELAQRFHSDTHSILLATRTFFEGVDFPGDTCSLAVVMRFPNLRPDDPLTQARRNVIEAAGGSSWAQYQEPVMQMLFRQAAGRAVRRTDDRGVVAVLDPRSGSKQYAVRALKGLAPSDYTDSAGAVEEFLTAETSPLAENIAG